MKNFKIAAEKIESLISDENHKKVIFLFSFSYYFLSIFILYFVFSSNLGVFTYDSGFFHSEAIRYANLLNEGGITSLPRIVRYNEYQFPGVFSGIVYYLFGYYNPLLIVIFNIFIKSLSIYFLYSIFYKVTEEKFISFIGILPFFLFPTEFGNVALINKGVFFSLAFILLLNSFVSKRKMIMINLLFAFFIFSAVRPQYFHFLYNIAYAPTESPTKSLQIPLKTWHHNFEQSTRWVNPPEFEKICKYKRFDKLKIIFSKKWRYTQIQQPSFFNYLFEKIYARFDGLAKTLVAVRNDPLIMASKSNFDYATLPSNGKEFLFYIPKGFFVGLFKPYPTEWFVLENRTNKIFYLAASFEAIILYLGIMLFLFSLYRWRNKKSLFIMTFLCLSAIMIYGTVSYNLGCLYRHRGVFINIVCGIGLMYCPILLSRARIHLYKLKRFFLNIISKITPSKFTDNKLTFKY